VIRPLNSKKLALSYTRNHKASTLVTGHMSLVTFFGMEAKAREFTDAGAEIYSKA
jgi:hypothetical protein